MANTEYIGKDSVGDIRNLWMHLALATEEEKTRGKAWYATAHADVCKLATSYNVSVEQVSKVTAVISPQRYWERNVMDAASLIAAWSVNPDNYRLCRIPLPSGWTPVRIAFDILSGKDVRLGRKVASFVDNILYPDCSQEVTIDSHAIKAWLGRPDAGAVQFAPSLYNRCAADYRKVAQSVGMLPLQAQAVIWIVRKRLLAEGCTPE